jgi:hypothetical protein
VNNAIQCAIDSVDKTGNPVTPEQLHRQFDVALATFNTAKGDISKMMLNLLHSDEGAVSTLGTLDKFRAACSKLPEVGPLLRVKIEAEEKARHLADRLNRAREKSVEKPKPDLPKAQRILVNN